jgi:hypothetical protein
MMQLDELETGAVYEVRSRNLIVGVYNGAQGFIGVREKFGSEYLFTEYLSRECGGTQIGVDTVHPVAKIGRVAGNALTEHYGLICTNCGKGAWKDENWSYPEGNHCAGGCSSADQDIRWTMNQLLFDVLKAMEQPIRDRMADEYPTIMPPWRDTKKAEATDE